MGGIRVNRAPVLTLWAAVVAEAAGHPEPLALALGAAIAGTSAVARAGPAKGTPGTVQLLGREVLLADAAAQSPEAVRAYLERSFGPHLPEVRAAMRDLAAALTLAELDRRGLDLYAAFRPEASAEGRLRGMLETARIRGALRH